MTQQTKNFTLADPRTFDGDPFEVAERATRQALALTELLVETLAGANVMARNSSMERDMYFGKEPDAPGWPDTPQGRMFEATATDVENVKMRLTALAKAAGYNPRKPPRI